ncbi:hypothetical protein F0224_00440 [Vibrio coralliilyticus]|uniref:hypothetical protein n=1 Tax=Vibrio coralliilyticus TaxID=190893 RepID=UPI000BAC29C3|nr:hypothetical protein [Vibrio coralliilyticus]NOI74124.1 hypothetical protein [Vibrio coralliilyticus]PAW04731.1 hypothetical protein CKJ79_00435 [Vibrio coralliilyticus]
MSHLPFYITLEEFSEFQKKQIEDIVNSTQVFSWTSFNLDEKDRWLRKKWWFFPILLISALLIGIGLVANIEMWKNMEGLAISTLVGLSIGWFATYISFASDDRFDYILSKKGIVVHQSLGEPLWVPNVVKIIGFLGSAVCLILVAFVGPAVLVGAGSFMLVSFFLINRKQNEPYRRVVPYDQFMAIRANRERNIICIFTSIDSCIPSIKNEGYIYRALAKASIPIFPENEAQYSNIISLLESDIGLVVENVEDLDLIYDPEQGPESFKTFHQKGEHYSMEKAVTKRDHPAPPPKKPR